MTLFDLGAFSSILGSIAYAAIVVFAIWKRGFFQRAAPALAQYGLLSFIWAVWHVLQDLGLLPTIAEETIPRFSMYGLIVLTLGFLYLGQAFLLEKVLHVGWLLLTGGLVAALWMIDANQLVIPASEWTTAWVAGWVILMGRVGLQSLGVYRRAQHPIQRRRAAYWIIALCVIAVGDVFYASGHLSTGFIVHLAGVLIAVYTVMVQRLPEMRRIMRKVFSYVTFFVLAVLLYTGGFIVVQTVYQLWPGNYHPVFIGLALALLLVLIVNPFLKRAEHQIKDLIPTSALDTATILRQYSKSITNILDLQLLATVVVGTASEAMEVQRGFLFMVNYEKGSDGNNYFQLRGVKGMGDDKPASITIPERSPLVEYFRHSHSPLLQYDIDHLTRFRNIADPVHTWLSTLATEVYIPVYSKDEWIGLLALGPKSSGKAFWESDLDLLSILADQTAVAMENVRLVEGLLRLNTEFRRAYSGLDQANRHLERLDRTKSDFISIASHELRTPLTIISGSTQMLLDEPDIQNNPYHRQLFSKINSGTQRLHEIVDSMLDMAKVDTRDLQLEPQPVSMHALLDALCAQLRKVFEERKQELVLLDLKGLPSIDADVEALRKVFYHLLMNALKYTPDGGKVTISGCEAPPGGAKELPKGGLEIIVSDTGIGIDPRYQELIFVKFYQTGELALHSTGKTKFKGSGPGLGLAIARGIVEAHGGKIWVESAGYDEKKCPGSQFHVLLPLRQVNGQAVIRKRMDV